MSLADFERIAYTVPDFNQSRFDDSPIDTQIADISQRLFEAIDTDTLNGADQWIAYFLVDDLVHEAVRKAFVSTVTTLCAHEDSNCVVRKQVLIPDEQEEVNKQLNGNYTEKVPVLASMVDGNVLIEERHKSGDYTHGYTYRVVGPYHEWAKLAAFIEADQV